MGMPFESFVNPRHLEKHDGNTPKLIWPSLRHADDVVESDSEKIPPLEFITLRRATNKEAATTRDLQLLGCKVFWETFRSSRLVVIFDPHMTTRLLRRVRSELERKRFSGPESILLFGGKEQRSEESAMARDIESAIAKSRSTLKFRYVSDMESRLSPFPHDRFALTDGEFWHFGGTAGGFEECLTAVSRGWRAKNMGVLEFLESAWNVMVQERSSK